jgi:DNA-binding transcriptional ArsR family regulator
MSASSAEPAPQSPDDQLDRVFRALADQTRRTILRRLSLSSATVTELAAPLGMSLPGVSKHLTVLEQAGLVDRTVEGRARRCSLTPAALREADDWLAYYRSFWESALDSLADYAAAQRRGSTA